jgi:hypothetical protein
MKDEDLMDLVNKPKGKANPFAADRWDDPFAGDNPPGRLPTKTDALAQDILANPAPAPKPAKAAPRPAKRTSDFDALQAEIAKYEASKAQEAKPAELPTVTPMKTAKPLPAPAPRRDRPSGLAAGAYGFARGVTLGAIDRLVGIGTDLGETLGAAFNDTAPANPNAYQQGREDWLKAEDSAKREHPWMHLGGEFLGGVVPALATGGAGATPLTVGKTVIPKAVTSVAAPGFVAGAMSERSDNPKEQAKSGIYGAAGGTVLGEVAAPAVGKLVGKAQERMGKALLRDVVTSEGGAASTPSSAQRLVEKKAGVIDELKSDPELAKLTREDTEKAIERSKRTLAKISEPRAEYYEQMDKVAPLGLDEINVGLSKAINSAQNEAEQTVAKAAKRGFENFYLPKWEREGSIIKRPGMPAAVKGEAAREWVTQAQQPAADVLGSIAVTEHKKLKDYMADAVVDTWRGHLDQVAKTAPKLVADIRKYDKRASSLMAINETLGQRLLKENRDYVGTVQRGRRAIEKLGLSGAAALAAIGRTREAMALTSAYAAERSAPVAARAINDRMLVPLADAIASGKPWAEIVKNAAEIGVPQSTARTMFDIYQSKQKKGKR